MTYEIVNVKEKKMVGIYNRTSNLSPQMGEIIGGLWQKLYKDIYPNISHKVNNKRIGLYCEYDNDAVGEYTLAVGAEVNQVHNLKENTYAFIIPEGQYAKFTLKGNLHQIIGDFWAHLDDYHLDRSFIADFEEYQDFDMDETQIDVYIGLK